MTLCIIGFDDLVTSFVATIATGWSDLAGWDYLPLSDRAFTWRTPLIGVSRRHDVSLVRFRSSQLGGRHSRCLCVCFPLTSSVGRLARLHPNGHSMLAAGAHGALQCAQGQPISTGVLRARLTLKSGFEPIALFPPPWQGQKPLLVTLAEAKALRAARLMGFVRICQVTVGPGLPRQPRDCCMVHSEGLGGKKGPAAGHWASWVYAIDANTGVWKWRLKSNYPTIGGDTTAGRRRVLIMRPFLRKTVPSMPNRLKLHYAEQRPPFERVALVLQGGGALGSYQAGVYQALAEANLHPDWVAGISIGSVNAALIAGNPPEKRVEKLQEFWEAVSAPVLGPFGVKYDPSIHITDASFHRFLDQTRAFLTLLCGAPQFFTPRVPTPFLFPPASPNTLSYYDVAPLRATLERLVDFDRINAGSMRFSVGATNVRTGNLVCFDNTTDHIGPEHVMASGSLPPGFPVTEIDGEYYWDGGCVSNTPLQWVFEARPSQDTLAFQVDLWGAAGEVPRDFLHVAVREKEIRFSSRTLAMTDQYKNAQKVRKALAELLKQLPAELRNRPEAKLLAQQADEKVCNIVHLIYRSKPYEGVSKDFEFSRRTMVEHWQAGFEDAVRSLSHPEILQRPDRLEAVRTFDYSKTAPAA